MSELGDKLRALRQKYLDAGGKTYSIEEIEAQLGDYEDILAERDALRKELDEARIAHQQLFDDNVAWESTCAVKDKELADMTAKYQFMVDNVAKEKLDGYRALGQRAADAEAERDALKIKLLAIKAAIDEIYETPKTPILHYKAVEQITKILKEKL